MSKSNEAAQDAEIERIEGEEQFINEPKSVAETNPGIKWENDEENIRSEMSQRALDMLDYSPNNPYNTNPLD